MLCFVAWVVVLLVFYMFVGLFVCLLAVDVNVLLLLLMCLCLC